ncbi:peptidylprolyl isomerase [Ammonicoccus fulvus]|uniref:Peptidylprolyl isomerase n=1 Tax=Ammonicoccus fulvus TaxID=3138240 RepID=A0ABZ3FNS9_9ACTN
MIPVSLAVVVVGALAACSPQNTATNAPTSGSTAGGAASACTYEPFGEPAKAVDPPSPNEVQTSGEVSWTITTNEGPVNITMDRAKTPCTIHSFESLAKQGFYDDTDCHRLVDSGIFVLQCGDPTGTGRGGPGYRFADETDSGMKYPAGTVAMANSGRDTNGSQFFLVYAESQLPPAYTVFGRMDPESLDVVGRIAAEGQDGRNSDGSGKPNNYAHIVEVKQRA